MRLKEVLVWEAFEFAVRDDFEVHTFFTRNVVTVRPSRQDTTLWYSEHGDEYVGLGAEVDVEWHRQQASKRFIMKLRGYL